jgi:hypothetical protein
MTEDEWFASVDPAALGEVVCRKKRASARVLRLYMASFWHWQSDRLSTPEERELLRDRAALVEQWAETGTRSAATHVSGVFLVFYDSSPREGFRSTVRAPSGWDGGEPASARAVWLLREVFGNPFTTGRRRKRDPRRGWAFEPAWRTDTVTALAHQMYESRDFSAMPILADALQDAGCDNPDLLAHCRDQAEHVRGCWALDLILARN